MLYTSPCLASSCVLRMGLSCNTLFSCLTIPICMRINLYELVLNCVFWLTIMKKALYFCLLKKNSILIKKNVCDLVVYWLHRIHGISCLLTAKSKHHIYEAGDKILHYYIFAKMSTRFNLYLLDIQCSGYREILHHIWIFTKVNPFSLLMH